MKLNVNWTFEIEDHFEISLPIRNTTFILFSGSNFTFQAAHDEWNMIITIFSSPFSFIGPSSWIPSSLSRQRYPQRPSIVCRESSWEEYSILENSLHEVDLLDDVGESVWNDCDHDDDGYQQNYTSGADLSDILSKV